MSLLTRATWAAERGIHAVGRALEGVARAGKPSSVKLTQFQTTNIAHWSVATTLEALEQHEYGQFAESARLAKAFGRDERISACRNTRIRALIGRHGATFQLKPSEEGDQRRAGTVADRVQKLWFQRMTEAALSRIQADVIDLGVSISRIHWERGSRTDKQWLPRLEPYSMEYVRWDYPRGCYVAYTQEGEVEVRPDTGEWLIVEPAGQLGWMAGAVRALAMAFFFRSMTWKDWARYCEKHGVPILAIEEPSGEMETTKGSTSGSKANFFAQLKRIGREGILRLPRSSDGKKGYNARFIEPKSLSWPAFQAFLERLDTCIAIFLLGQNLSTEVKGGSFAAAVAQNRVRLDYLAADAEALSGALRTQVWMWWGRFNFDWWDDALTPWPTWATAEPDDLKSRSIMLSNVANGLNTLKLAKAPIDERAILDGFGIAMLTPQEATKKAAEDAAKAAEDAAKAAEENPAQTPATEPNPADTPAKDENAPTDKTGEDAAKAQKDSTDG